MQCNVFDINRITKRLQVCVILSATLSFTSNKSENRLVTYFDLYFFIVNIAYCWAMVAADLVTSRALQIYEAANARVFCRSSGVGGQDARKVSTIPNW